MLQNCFNLLSLGPAMDMLDGGKLVGLLHDQPVKVIEAAIFALSWIGNWPSGVQAALEAKALDHVAELLQSPQSGVRRWTCWMVGSLWFLHDQPVEVIEAAMYALSEISSWLNVSSIWGPKMDLLDGAKLAEHEAIAVAILG
ncbi:hypothetical protein B0H13DRAFT_2360593 [Mycena leptocephala]|nr:hypothetical protein B0H13DRAFT_2360593 [Mycena leptocephala]